MKLGKSLIAGSTASAISFLLLSANVAQAALETIPDSTLNSSPGVYTAGGYYTNDLGPNIVTTDGGNAANVGGASGRNDDGYMALDLGFDVTFFDNTYSSLFINNNGNVSFGSGISAYVPEGPTGADAPIISPFFSDVDTRSSDSGLVHYNLGDDQLVVTWDNVGFYDSNATLTDSFQLVLRGQDYTIPNGEGAIGFFYQSMGYSSTETNDVAAAGFGDGNSNGEQIEGSLTETLHETLQNKYIWFDADLDVIPPDPTNPPPSASVPEPAPLALMALGLVVGGIASRRKLRA